MDVVDFMLDNGKEKVVDIDREDLRHWARGSIVQPPNSEGAINSLPRMAERFKASLTDLTADREKD